MSTETKKINKCFERMRDADDCAENATFPIVGKFDELIECVTRPG